MQKVEKHLSKAFVISSMYLLTIIIGGFFVLPGIFDIEDYSLPLALELFLKITATLAIIIVIASAVIIPITKLLFQNPKRIKKSPVLVAAGTLFLGFILIFLHGLYVKLKTCTLDDTAWHCDVEGKAYVGMLVLAFFIASTLGVLTWIVQKFNKK